MSEVTASIVVQFGTEGSSGVLSAEIDGRPEGLNAGKTSFSAGDNPAFLVFKSSDVVIDDIVSSAGGIAGAGSGVMAMEEFLSFAYAREATLQKPRLGAVATKWLGRSLGAPTVVGDGKIVVPAAGVAVLKVNYNAPYIAYRLTGIPSLLNGESTFNVLIVVRGHAP